MNLKFPVLIFDKQHRFLSISNKKRLTTVAYSEWERGCYDKLFIVDSSGLGYQVREARKIGYPGFFLGYSLLKQRCVKVDLVYEAAPLPVSLDDLKQRILNLIRAGANSWGAADLEKLLAELQGTTSHQALIKLFFNKSFYHS